MARIGYHYEMTSHDDMVSFNMSASRMEKSNLNWKIEKMWLENETAQIVVVWSYEFERRYP